jgi:hypothetical protein
MSHLSLETIARLVEDSPNAEESAHLESCAECRSELETMTEDVHALGMLPDMETAPDQWQTLERRLNEEGLIRTRGARYGLSSTRMLQIAAALMLFVGGSVAGRLSAEPEVVTVTQLVPAPQPVETTLPPPATLATETPTAAPQPEIEPAPAAPRPTPNATLAANAVPRAPARTLDEATRLLRETEDLYLSALTRYAELATQSEAGDPVARLAALESIIMTTQAALSQTPTDPVINGYHLTALAQRDATFRQVAAASSDRWY